MSTKRALESVGEVISVDAREVDSIRGAKPEPEERPAFITTELDRNTGDVADLPTPPPGEDVGVQRLILQQNPTVRTELSVDELGKMIGRNCRNCLHFNLPLGQQLIANEMQNGPPEVIEKWANTIAEIAMWRPELAGEEFVLDPFEKLPAEREILKIGLCQAMSTPAPDDNLFVHVDFPSCPSQDMVGQELFIARTREIAQNIEAMRSRLLGAAGAATPSFWQRLKSKFAR